MKINPLTEAVRFFNQVKGPLDGHSRRQNSDSHQDAKQNPEPQEGEQKFADLKEETLDQAVEAFEAESQTRSKGLNVNVKGVGPGLKVVLTDGSGAVVRQFTGEEFLRLREAASRDSRARGKILDQKF